MGKITGFRDSPRVACPQRPPLERIEDFAPFRQPLPAETRREQAGRCMDCGVPFCQAGVWEQGAWLGCPLHNRVPEWNDMLWRGNGSQALSRLLKTNCFPEFTGRVCPAPCEKACVCGTFGQPVTIRDNELAIIEEAFAGGTWAPTPRTSGLEKPSRWWAPGRRGWQRPTTSTGGATPSLCWSSPPGRVGCSPMVSPP